MSAELKFYANGYEIPNTQGSGLGFYGANFGSPLTIGGWNQRTFVTSSDGTTQGVEADNCQWVSSTGVVLGSTGSGIHPLQVPNHQATVEVRLTNDTAVTVPTATAYFYDRYSIYNAPSGITYKALEIIHPGITQDSSGSGDTSWLTPAGSSVTVSLAPSPGVSGLYAGNGSNSTWSDTEHSWFMAISCSPDTIGSKLGGLFVTCEFN